MNLGKLVGTIVAAGSLAATGVWAQSGSAGASAATVPGPSDTTKAAPGDTAENHPVKSERSKKKAKKRKNQGRTASKDTTYGTPDANATTTDAQGVSVPKNNPINNAGPAARGGELTSGTNATDSSRSSATSGSTGSSTETTKSSDTNADNATNPPNSAGMRGNAGGNASDNTAKEVKPQK